MHLGSVCIGEKKQAERSVRGKDETVTTVRVSEL